MAARADRIFHHRAWHHQAWHHQAWILTLAGSLAALPAAAVDVAAAKKQFETSCGVCHTVDPSGGNRQGPNLATVFGRKAGTFAGFAYSDTLKNGGWTWDEKALDPWIENAQAAHPGTFMNYRQANPDKRTLVIAYLKSLQGSK